MNVTGSAEPSDLQWLTVILMVPVGPCPTATLARLPLGKTLSSGDPGKNLGAILRIAAISVALSSLDSLGVALVESPVHPASRVAPWLTKITASLRAESAARLDWAKWDVAMLAWSKLHPSMMAIAREKTTSPVENSQD